MISLYSHPHSLTNHPFIQSHTTPSIQPSFHLPGDILCYLPETEHKHATNLPSVYPFFHLSANIFPLLPCTHPSIPFISNIHSCTLTPMDIHQSTHLNINLHVPSYMAMCPSCLPDNIPTILRGHAYSHPSIHPYISLLAYLPAYMAMHIQPSIHLSILPYAC